ncbi:MAG TPA: energy transducer TonB [Opitutaceae bacterium]
MNSVSAREWSPPPHPTLLLADYRGRTHQVVSVENGQPVVLIDGKRRVLKGNIPLSTERLHTYGGTRATITDLKVGGVVVVWGEFDTSVREAASRPRGTAGGFAELTATITADEDLSDCFIAWFAIDESFIKGESDRPDAQIRIKEIGDLRADVPTSLKFSTSPFLGQVRRRTFVLLFSAGNEIRTNHSPNAADYFHRRERAVHSVAVKKWIDDNRNATRPLQPTLQIPPLLDDMDGLPGELAARLDVNSDGLVTDVTLGDGLPGSTEPAVVQALQAWLFLPKLENGTPVAAKVGVPLRF